MGITDKLGLNPLQLMKMANDLKKFLSSHQCDFPKSSNNDEIIVQVDNTIYQIKIKDQSVAELSSLPASGNYVKLSSKSLEELADMFGVKYSSDIASIKELFSKMASAEGIKNYKKVLNILSPSFQTNISFTDIVKAAGGAL
jgi:hypothetical protein